MNWLRGVLACVLVVGVASKARPKAIINKRGTNDAEAIINKRSVDVIDQTRDDQKRHPEELDILLRDEEGNDVRLRMRRGLTPDITYESKEGNVTTLSERETDEDAFYEVEGDSGVVAVRSVEEASGRFRRTLSGSFLLEDEAFVVEPPASHLHQKREADDTEKHYLIKRFDLETSEKGSRVRRSFQNLGVEVYLVIDYSLYQHFLSQNRQDSTTAMLEIRRYFAHIMSGVDIRYANLKESDFAVYVRVVGIHIITSSRVSTFTTSTKVVNPGIRDPNMINSNLALDALRDWDQDISSRWFISKSDHVMAFTKKNLYKVAGGSADDGAVGIAFTKVVCTTSAYSLIEDHGVFGSEGTAAHELGHSMGARYHDGQGGASRCPANEQYIMTAISSSQMEHWNYMNPYRFSSCSVDQFRQYFSTLGSKNCMLNRAAHISGWERPANEMPGQILDANAQCAGINGPGSIMCPFGQVLSDICRSLSCTTDAKGNHCTAKGIAARGTSCGDKKWCDNGDCVHDPKAPAIDENCPFGDSANGYNGQSCTSLIQREPYRCYEEKTFKKCCGSCNKIKKRKQGCEFGDREAFCGGLSSRQCTVGWNNWHCSCEKCAGTTVSKCRDDPLILWSGKPCTSFVTSAHKYSCYQDEVSDTCCESCQKFVNKANPGCLFGDNDNYQFTLGSRKFKCSDMRADPDLKKKACATGGPRQRCCETCH